MRWRRRRCPHSDLQGLYGDMVNLVGGFRLRCRDCGRYLDGPVTLAKSRSGETQRGLVVTDEVIKDQGPDLIAEIQRGRLDTFLTEERHED